MKKALTSVGLAFVALLAPTAALAAECVPENPADTVTYTEWKTENFDCGDEFVQITRTMTVTPREGAPMVAYQTETRALTEEEKCDPVTQEQQGPEAESPEEILAETGVSPALGLTIAGGLMAGGAALTIRNRRGA